jgi:hypothetical protein
MHNPSHIRVASSESSGHSSSPTAARVEALDSLRPQPRYDESQRVVQTRQRNSPCYTPHTLEYSSSLRLDRPHNAEAVSAMHHESNSDSLPNLCDTLAGQSLDKLGNTTLPSRKRLSIFHWTGEERTDQRKSMRVCQSHIFARDHDEPPSDIKWIFAAFEHPVG